MTTILSVATRECIAIACDSLATDMRPMVDPYDLMGKFFEFKDSKKGTDVIIKKDKDGNPLLKNYTDIYPMLEDIPYNQLPTVTKIFHLHPANAGLLISGASIIKERSLKNIIEEFLAKDDISKYLRVNYSIKGIADKLYKFIKAYYDEAFKDMPYKPGIEMLLSGYSKAKSSWQPIIKRLSFGVKEDIEDSFSGGKYGVAFGGQYDVIQRVVRGLDELNYYNVQKQYKKILNKYYDKLMEYVEKENIDIEIPHPDLYKDLADNDWEFSGLSTPYSNLSDQAAIDFVHYLVDIMIKSQQFNNRLPTVGGDIHIAIITKSKGFQWISREEYKYKDYGVPKHAEKSL
jgi:hypothetical protein